jgi:hypothetical protein
MSGKPEQNGLAKHHHRHIVKAGLTLLSHISVPIKLWTTTFNTTVFLINRLPTSILGYKSPHEVVLVVLLLMTLSMNFWVHLLPITCTIWSIKTGL